MTWRGNKFTSCQQEVGVVEGSSYRESIVVHCNSLQLKRFSLYMYLAFSVLSLSKFESMLSSVFLFWHVDEPLVDNGVSSLDIREPCPCKLGRWSEGSFLWHSLTATLDGELRSLFSWIKVSSSKRIKYIIWRICHYCLMCHYMYYGKKIIEIDPVFVCRILLMQHLQHENFTSCLSAWCSGID